MTGSPARKIQEPSPPKLTRTLIILDTWLPVAGEMARILERIAADVYDVLVIIADRAGYGTGGAISWIA
jgi:hypothetical protein